MTDYEEKKMEYQAYYEEDGEVREREFEVTLGFGATVYVKVSCVYEEEAIDIAIAKTKKKDIDLELDHSSVEEVK